MALQLGGAIAPFLDNWPLQRQLWASTSHMPGNELKLVPQSRNLTLQIRDTEGNLVISSSELQSAPLIRVLNGDRGTVEINLTGSVWETLRADQSYIFEIYAFGGLRDSFIQNFLLPDPGSEFLAGGQIFGSPRSILEHMGMVPGASVQTAIDLSNGWLLGDEGYWTRVIQKPQRVFGLWINDKYAGEVEYERLALSGDRTYAVVAGGLQDTIYYKGPENLNTAFVETAFSRQVLHALEIATADIERRAGRAIARQRVYRELHRSTYRKNQLSARVYPIKVDRFFRLDCYTRNRSLLKRFTENDIAGGVVQQGYTDESSRIFVDGATGMVTLTQSFWDWVDWGYDVNFRYGASYFPSGEVSLELTYDGGYDPVPVDISEAAAAIAAIKQMDYWERTISQGFGNGIEIGCVNMNFADAKRYQEPWRQMAEDVISNYQRIEIEAF